MLHAKGLFRVKIGREGIYYAKMLYFCHILSHFRWTIH